jgi:hypothetical protein
MKFVLIVVVKKRILLFDKNGVYFKFSLPRFFLLRLPRLMDCL